MGIEVLAGAALFGSVLSGGISAGGKIMSGMAAQDAANYRAAVANNMATYSEKVGAVKAQAQGMKVGQILGQQRAAQGASGLDVNSLSAVDTRATAAEMGRLDELTILNDATNKAKGLRAQADLDKMSGENSMLEGWIGASSSIAGAATSVSDKWLSYRTKGIFS